MSYFFSDFSCKRNSDTHDVLLLSVLLLRRGFVCSLLGRNRSDIAQKKPDSARQFQGGNLKAKNTFESKYLKAKIIFESKKTLLWGKTQSKQAEGHCFGLIAAKIMRESLD